MSNLIRVLSPHGRPTMVSPSTISAVWLNWDKEKMCVVKLSCNDGNLYFSEAMELPQVGPYLEKQLGMAPDEAARFAKDSHHYEETPRSFT